MQKFTEKDCQEMQEFAETITEKCPMQDMLARLGDKWSILVLVALSTKGGKPLRFSELKRTVEGVSQRMLTRTVRNLERDGIITRTVYPEVPPRVEYALTERGLRFLHPVRDLIDWITLEWPEIQQSRSEYDQQNHV